MGYLEEASCTQIKGWAYNGTDERLVVDLFEGATLIGSATADQMGMGHEPAGQPADGGAL
jgi:hypothetical protein